MERRSWLRLKSQILIISSIKLIFVIAVQFWAAIFLYGVDIKCTYQKGTIESIDGNLTGEDAISTISEHSTVTLGKILASGPNSRGEFMFSNGDLFRLGTSSVANWKNRNELWLHSGSVLFCLPNTNELSITSQTSNGSFTGSGTFIVEATQNGGFKFIPLEAKGILSTPKGGSKEVVGGRMILVLGDPSYFGDAYDIDLLLLLKSSRLVSAFPQALPTMRNIILSLYVQDIKLKGKYDALIGDATSDDNLQIWKFGEKNNNL